MSVKAKFAAFNHEGRRIGGGQMYLPRYLDWMPIDVKVFWFTQRGLGDPAATQVLFESQGEQRLLTIIDPLQRLTLKELTEKENELQDQVDRFIEEGGYSRDPRNQ